MQLSIKKLAELTHEANRTLSRQHGDTTMSEWANLPQPHREEMIGLTTYFLKNPQVVLTTRNMPSVRYILPRWNLKEVNVQEFQLAQLKMIQGIANALRSICSNAEIQAAGEEKPGLVERVVNKLTGKD